MLKTVHHLLKKLQLRLDIQAVGSCWLKIGDGMSEWLAGGQISLAQMYKGKLASELTTTGSGGNEKSASLLDLYISVSLSLGPLYLAAVAFFQMLCLSADHEIFKFDMSVWPILPWHQDSIVWPQWSAQGPSSRSWTRFGLEYLAGGLSCYTGVLHQLFLH